MNKKKKTAPTQLSQNGKRQNKYNIKAEASPVCIADLLRNGSEQAISVEELLRFTGIKSRRELQEQIAKERRTKVILSSNTGGFYLPSVGDRGRQETELWIQSMRHRAYETLLATVAAQQYLNNGQA